MQKHNLPPIAADPDLSTRIGEIRAPEHTTAFEARRAKGANG